MQQFQGQHFVDRGGIVPIPFKVAPHYTFDPRPFEVRP